MNTLCNSTLSCRGTPRPEPIAWFDIRLLAVGCWRGLVFCALFSVVFLPEFLHPGSDVAGAFVYTKVAAGFRFMDLGILALGVCREYRITSLTFTVRAALGSGKIGSRKRVHLIGCLRELAGPFFAAHAWLFLLFPQDICKALPERNSLSKLWVRQISFHSAR